MEHVEPKNPLIMNKMSLIYNARFYSFKVEPLAIIPNVLDLELCKDIIPALMVLDNNELALYILGIVVHSTPDEYSKSFAEIAHKLCTKIQGGDGIAVRVYLLFNFKRAILWLNLWLLGRCCRALLKMTKKRMIMKKLLTQRNP
jgi:hypothetical protein